MSGWLYYICCVIISTDLYINIHTVGLPIFQLYKREIPAKYDILRDDIMNRMWRDRGFLIHWADSQHAILLLCSHN